MAARFDFKFNGANSGYFRFFRDDGDNLQPEGVTGRRALPSTALPQNAVYGWQSVISPTLLNELKVGYNSAKTRINGQAPTINGLDLSAIVAEHQRQHGELQSAGSGCVGRHSGAGRTRCAPTQRRMAAVSPTRRIHFRSSTT